MAVPRRRGDRAQPAPADDRWAVLYTLSMLARYQPAEWAAHINIDVSRHAVAVESLLKSAITLLPALIIEAISQVADTS